jgi:CRP/FNR family transcriptional regulator, cyclic AMP receptor protein
LEAIQLSNSVNRTPALDAQTSGRLIATTLLRQALGFRHCEPQAVEDLVAAGRVVLLGKGEYVVRRGDPFDNLCVIIEGSLEASVSHRDGRCHLFAYLQPGDIAGLMSLLDGQPHANDMASREPSTRVLLVPGREYRLLRDRYPSIARALEVQMAYRSRLLHERLMGDTSMSLDVRLARLLHLQSAISGRKLSDGFKVTMKMSQADIGNFLGVSRQRANFAAQQLKKDGLIVLHYSEVTIVDPAGLARRAGV